MCLATQPVHAQRADSGTPSGQARDTRIAAGSGQAKADFAGDVEMPEAATFLHLAGEEMAKYHIAHKVYAAQWYRLGFDYAYPTYHLSDPGLRAVRADRNRWKPHGSHFTYVIAAAHRRSFLIRALDDSGKTAWELRQGMRFPKRTGESPGPAPPRK